MKIDFGRFPTGQISNPDETIFHFTPFEERDVDFKNTDAYRFAKLLVLDFVNKNELTTELVGIKADKETLTYVFADILQAYEDYYLPSKVE
jgi:hypothetical protein